MPKINRLAWSLVDENGPLCCFGFSDLFSVLPFNVLSVYCLNHFDDIVSMLLSFSCFDFGCSPFFENA